MLGKLMKYEIKATKRIFLPLYGLILIFAVINKLIITFRLQMSNNFLPNLISGISMMVYFLLIAAVLVMTLVVTVRRFQKNLLGDEGYLSFTLPVEVHSHIDSKMIVSLMWTVLSVVVAAFSGFIFGLNSGFSKLMASLWNSITEFSSRYGALGWSLVVSVVILVLVFELCTILSLYVSVVVGNLSSKHKLLAGFGTFLGVSIVQQIAFFSIFNDNIFLTLELRTNATGQLWAAQIDVLILIVFFALFGIAFYFFTNWMLSKKLNLE